LDVDALYKRRTEEDRPEEKASVVQSEWRASYAVIVNTNDCKGVSNTFNPNPVIILLVTPIKS
jgi:hypothetical protein